MSALAIAQTSLYSEDFESGGGSMSLNTATQGGDVGLAGDNAWVINNAYTGGSGTSSCFSLSFTIGNTAAQPGGINNSPNSSYMHIVSDDGTANGINNANYVVADGSFCFFASSNFSEMTSDISTIGYTSVTLDFWWMCQGSADAYGEVYYSTDAGTTWNLITSPISQYNFSSNWSNQQITNAAWDNQATLRFGYRFVNNVATAGSDPSFSIDDIEIIGTSGGGGSNTITTGTNLTPNAWCEGNATTILVDFTSTGTFNSGNVYTAELSDATGSFAAPTSVGTLTSTANSGTITAVIPGGTPAGNGYRIRVVSDNPATVGSDNGSDIVINALPTVTQAPFSDVCSTGGVVNLVGGSPTGGSYSGTGASGSQFDPSVAGVGSFPLTYSYTDGNGCSSSATETITVIQGPTVTLAPFSDVCDSDPFFTLTGGNPSNGTYSGPGVTAGVFNPSSAGVGVHTITYTFTDGNGCDGTAFETITVNDCASLSETSLTSFQLMPNPANAHVKVVTSGQYDQIELIDMQGRVLQQHGAETNTLDVSKLSGGVYMVRVKFGSSTHEERLIIR